MRNRILKSLRTATNHKILMHWHLGKIQFIRSRMAGKSHVNVDYKKHFTYKGRERNFVFVFYVKIFRRHFNGHKFR